MFRRCFPPNTEIIITIILHSESICQMKVCIIQMISVFFLQLIFMYIKTIFDTEVGTCFF